MTKIQSYGFLFLVLACFCLCGAGSAAPKQDQLKKQYEESLAKLKDDDDAGLQKLAQWCQANKLTKEAAKTWETLLARKRDKLAANPTVAGYQALIQWCAAQGLKQAADDLKHDMLVLDYGQRKEKLKPNDAAELLALAQWCQAGRLSSEAMDCLQGALKLEPDNVKAKGLLESIRVACWNDSPTGLLKNQKVPGYTQENAWYHISVPKDYKNSKTGMPLIIYLHGGQHNAGTADNIVALAQVVPSFKKNIVLFPNHLKTWWAHPRELAYLLETLDNVMLRWHIDPKRIYLMGGSMGGNGVWAFGCQCPELFAGLSPIAGFYDDFLGFDMKKIVSKPIYVLHGKNDGTVPIAGARKAYELLKKEGANIVMREADSDHQPSNDEVGKAADWILQYSNKQDFDMKVLKEGVSKLPVAGWLKQYEGN